MSFQLSPSSGYKFCTFFRYFLEILQLYKTYFLEILSLLPGGDFGISPCSLPFPRSLILTGSREFSTTFWVLLLRLGLVAEGTSLYLTGNKLYPQKLKISMVLVEFFSKNKFLILTE